MAFEFDLARFIPFRDQEACARARAIRREDLTRHPNPDFHVRIIEGTDDFFLAFALDLVRRIQAAAAEGRRFVAILPCGPLAQYDKAAAIINELRLSLAHVHTFNMDEFADQDGRSAPGDWPGSFQYAMWQRFFSRIDEDLRPPAAQIHFPSSANIADYGQQIADLGGAEVCYGGIGWCGHLAFWEPHLAEEFADVEAWRGAHAAHVRLHPMTILHNALRAGGDWSSIPPCAYTIGPQIMLSAQFRSFWLDAYLGSGMSWQRFIGRLATHGPVTPLVPASFLQTAPGEVVFLQAVAADIGGPRTSWQ